MVPVPDMGAPGLDAVSRRLFYRVAGCLAGAALAGAILILSQGRVELLIAGTALGVLIGRHIENGDSRFAYVGTQFTLAVLVTLVPDSYAHIEIGSGIDRLFGILVGMAALEATMMIWRCLERADGD